MYRLENEVSIALDCQLCSTRKSTSVIKVAAMKNMVGAVHPIYINYHLKVTCTLCPFVSHVLLVTQQGLFEKHLSNQGNYCTMKNMEDLLHKGSHHMQPVN